MNQHYMVKALYQAYRGLGSTSPNPSVGAVLVKNSQIISQGHTEPPPGRHAEVVAIEAAGENARGADLYVTLEPCCFYGRTPACSDLIIRAGIKRVFICVEDPHHRVCGSSIKILQKNGIEVNVGLASKQGKYLNRFFFKHLESKFPYITVKMAQTLDGYSARIDGTSKWISSWQSRRIVHKMRSTFDCVLVGYNTFVADNPSLDVRIVASNKNPSRVIVWSAKKCIEEIFFEYTVFKDSKTQCIIFYNGEICSDEEIKTIKKRFSHIVFEKTSVKGDFLDIGEIFLKLKSKYNFLSVLCEGGSALASNIIHKNLFDEIVVFTSPQMFLQGKKSFDFSVFQQDSEGFELEPYTIKKSGSDVLGIYHKKGEA